MFPCRFLEFSLFCKKISMHVSMQHVKTSSNLDYWVNSALSAFVICLFCLSYFCSAALPTSRLAYTWSRNYVSKLFSNCVKLVKFNKNVSFKFYRGRLELLINVFLVPLTFDNFSHFLFFAVNQRIQNFKAIKAAWCRSKWMSFLAAIKTNQLLMYPKSKFYILLKSVTF